nr:hypothetical protein [Tanacetum cinerariifolium]
MHHHPQQVLLHHLPFRILHLHKINLPYLMIKPPQEQPATPYESSMPLLTTLIETCVTLSQKVAELEQDKNYQALEILQLKKRVKKLEKKQKSKSLGFKRLRKIEAIDADEGITLVDVETNKEVVAMDAKSQKRINQEEVNAASKGVSAAEPTRLHDEEVQKAAARDKQEKADIERALELQRQYDDKEENIDWSDAYQVFEDILKGFDREDLVALWNLVKENFSSAVPIEDKEKALWIELKRLFEPDTDDVLWKLQRYMHAPLTWKFYSDCGVHHVSSTRGHDIFMLTEKDYPLLNAIMILMLGGKLQVEEDSEMARDLVMKIFI